MHVVGTYVFDLFLLQNSKHLNQIIMHTKIEIVNYQKQRERKASSTPVFFTTLIKIKGEKSTAKKPENFSAKSTDPSSYFSNVTQNIP